MIKPKIIVFDVDGVLLQGYEFSWKLIWEFLNYDDSIRKKGFSMYINKELTYQQWCEWCLKYFKDKKLSYQDLEKITKDIKVEESLFKLLKYCKKNSIKLGVVSGGIDVFLKIKIPELTSFIDENNIYINTFSFNEKHLLESVKSTPYDFDQKLDAIKKISSENNISLDKVMFLGDNLNDINALKYVGYGIAFNTKNPKVLDVAKTSCDTMKDILNLLEDKNN